LLHGFDDGSDADVMMVVAMGSSNEQIAVETGVAAFCAGRWVQNRYIIACDVKPLIALCKHAHTALVLGSNFRGP
jgi:hypothetical protein